MDNHSTRPPCGRSHRRQVSGRGINPVIAAAWGLLWMLSSAHAAADSFTQVVMTTTGDRSVLELVETSPIPEPGPGEVLLRVIAASASFTDVMVRKGLYAGIDAEPPYPPGYDLVGSVAKVGAGVSGFEHGQRVADLTVWGAYTEYIVRPAEGLVPVPDGLPADEAVSLVLAYVTAYQMLHRVADVQAGQTALIHGASGAVGTALSQLGHSAGLVMFGTASARKHDHVKANGVTPIDYRKEDFVAVTQAATDGRGVDVAFDAIGVDNFARSYRALAPGGLLVEYGFYRASLAGDSFWEIATEYLKSRWQQLKWTWLPEREKRFAFYSITDMRAVEPQWFREDLARLFQLALAGEITPSIWKRLPLEAAAEAHAAIETGKVQGKIILQVGPDMR